MCFIAFGNFSRCYPVSARSSDTVMSPDGPQHQSGLLKHNVDDSMNNDSKWTWQHIIQGNIVYKSSLSGKYSVIYFLYFSKSAWAIGKRLMGKKCTNLKNLLNYFLEHLLYSTVLTPVWTKLTSFITNLNSLCHLQTQLEYKNGFSDFLCKRDIIYVTLFHERGRGRSVFWQYNQQMAMLTCCFFSPSYETLKAFLCLSCWFGQNQLIRWHFCLVYIHKNIACTTI